LFTRKITQKLVEANSPRHIIEAIHDASSDEIGPDFSGVSSDIKTTTAALGQPMQKRKSFFARVISQSENV
jgi:hypothetical protein